MERRTILFTLGLFAAADAFLIAQTPAGNPTSPAGQRPTEMTKPATHGRMASDQTFASKVAAGGAAEVELAELAEQKSTDDTIKQLASRIKADHTKANQTLASIATEKGWTLPTQPAPEHTALKSKLEKLSGAEFDHAYAQAMVNDHKKDIAAFEHEAASGSDAALKSFASSTLPTLKQHLEMAETALKTAKPKS